MTERMLDVVAFVALSLFVGWAVYSFVAADVVRDVVVAQAAADARMAAAEDALRASLDAWVPGDEEGTMLDLYR